MHFMNMFLGFFQQSMTGIAAIDQALQLVFNYMPKILGAVLFLVLAWIVASIVKSIVKSGLKALGLAERLNTQQDTQAGAKMVGTISDIAYWVVFLFFVPVILNTLGIQGEGIFSPIQNLLGNIFGFLPNLLAAGLIFWLGSLIAKIVRNLVSSLLDGLGIDALMAKWGIKSFGEQSLSSVLGTVCYVLILIPVLSAALNALNMTTISQPITNVLETILNSLPNIFGAGIILVVSYFVGKIVSNLVTSLLEGIGFNKVPTALGVSNAPTDGEKSASSVVGKLTLLAIMLFAVMEAAKLLNFSLLAGLTEQLTIFGGNLLAGLIIFAIGMYLAQIAAKFIRESGFSSAETLAMVARLAILVFTGAMALRRMGIADDIVNLAFALILGAFAIATAIAFGIGGKDFAAKMLEKFSK